MRWIDLQLFKEIGWEVVDWINLAQDRDKWTQQWTCSFCRMWGIL